jgi:hypothetical protein
MSNYRTAAPVRGNSRAVRKRDGAKNTLQQQPKHNGRSRARQGRSGQRSKQRNDSKSSSGASRGASLSTWTPIAPPTRQWHTSWPSSSPGSKMSDTSSSQGRHEQLLTHEMRHARSLDDLLNLIIREGASFNHVHTTAALGFLHSKLQYSNSISAELSHSAQLARPFRSEQGSPLLGGEPMCMYIGDVSEPPLPQHGPMMWDSHARPKEALTSSLQELYTHGSASLAVQEVVGFPPKGAFPGVGPAIVLPNKHSLVHTAATFMFGPLYVLYRYL